MVVPMIVLSVGAIGAGYLGTEFTGRGVQTFLEPVFAFSFVAHNPLQGAVEEEIFEHTGFWAHYGLMVVSGTLAVFGILAAYVFYAQETWIVGLLKATFPRVYQGLWRKYYVDELYQVAVVEPARQAGRVCVGLDDYFIDGLLWLATAIPRGIGLMLRTMQSGLLQGYGFGMVAGIAVIMLVMLWA
jgi:NADH-quinone oxidoreductase subunit L